jgi:hypothetical protein
MVNASTNPTREILRGLGLSCEAIRKASRSGKLAIRQRLSGQVTLSGNGA